MFEKSIYGQDGYYKLSAKKSGETSINLSNEIANYIRSNSNREQIISFTIYLEDFYKALGYIANKLPLFVSSSKSSSEELYSDAFFQKTFANINAFFGGESEKIYQVNLLSREDGRFYLNKLEYNGFNVRKFLIAGHSKLIFDKINDKLVLRLVSGDLSDGEESSAPQPSPTHTALISSHQSLLLALRTKPFVLLAGISGTGKSRIVRELAYASCPKNMQEDPTTPGNYCMVEVKPNWHDSTELLGYYSSVSKKYYLTKFIHFLYKASLDENKNVPFFVCLDEMNLAPVEQYFAEFLSVLETRKFANKHIVTEQLIKKEEFEKCELPEEDDTVGNTRVQLVSDIKYSSKELEIIKHLKENGLVLPENVFVIGTVNMDDTTHQFSRKVIDRAMTIEMNGGKLMDMFGGSSKLAYVPDPLPLSAFLPKYVTADEVIKAHGNCEVQIKKQTVDLLDALNNTLKNTPFQISYRVLNELVIYLGNVLDDKGYDGDGMDETFTDYVSESFANIVMMKVLPRIEGDQELLEGKLDGIQAMTRNEKLNAKLQEMIDRLEDQSFTRFWA